jgi:hypothetical protein
MGFRGDDRGVTVQVGAVLLFGILIISMSMYQTTVVPTENEQVEFQHSKTVQSQMTEMRNGILKTAATGNRYHTSVSLGQNYPPRALFVNPPPISGQIATSPADQISLEHAEATGETADYWDGSVQQFDTRGVVYSPNYHWYTSAPETVYENSVVYNRFTEDIALSDQALVDGRQISLVTIEGELSRGSAETYSVEPRALSSSETTVTVSDDGEGDGITITLPTRLSESRWRQLLAEELDGGSPGVDNTGGAYIDELQYTTGDPYSTLTLTFEQGVSYDLKMAHVGVGSDTSEPETHYLTDVSAQRGDVSEGETRELVVEVRDEFNNPVTNEQVDVRLSDGPTGGTISAHGQSAGVSEELSDLTADEQGRVRLTYDAPVVDEDESVTVDVSYNKDPGDASFDPATREDLQYQFEVNNDAGGGTGEYDVRWDIDAIEAQLGEPCTDTDGDGRKDQCTVDSSVNKFDMTAETVPSTAQVFVDFASRNTTVAQFDTNSEGNTRDDGTYVHKLDVQKKGTTRLYVSAVEGSDVLTLEVV